ncbi:helix-turn-helix transcriptional regulator [Patescibacteria group bacterium]|jgi:DNA-binding XRE family transcriptional regulator|nr:helix-turn-helix transcriptional regulator [Patescibacteria group bacterium]
MSPKRKTVTSKLKKARLATSLTQKEVAKKIGISANYYPQIERGEKVPSLEIVEKLTKLLKVKSSDILPF